MNAIMGFSELIVNQYNNKQQLEKYSAIIYQRCNDLLDIINDILDISKIESGQLLVHMEECNLNDLFSELTTFFKERQKRTGKQQIKFILHNLCDPQENEILTDKVKLKQIFINLIDNAFKFTDDGRIEGGCKFDHDHKLMFYVSDTGIGIPSDKKDVIFERFTQLNQGTDKVVSGTGLGLPIVKGLVELLGGQIFIESEQGKGSNFSFTISYNTIQPIFHKPKIIGNITKSDYSDKTILIVEDDQYNVEYLKEVLSPNGFKIMITEYAKEAVQIAMAQEPDLILMDIRLPDMDGYEAIRLIKQNKPHLKIITQTAYASSIEKEKAFDAGCIDYISKPIKSELLLSMVIKHLAK